MKLYLAHPIVDRQWIREKELELEKKLNIELINPFYDSAERGDIKKLDSGMVPKEYDKDLNEKEIVEGDLGDVDRADGCLVVVTEKASVGIYMELFYNSYVLHKPAYLVILNEKVRTHPWLRYMATKIFISFEEFEKWYLNK